MKFDVPSRVIDKLFNSGYEEQIVDIVLTCKNNPNTEVSDIPISPTIMQESNEKIIISLKVYEIYKKLVQRINNPETSQEIPFLLLGNKREINGETCTIIEDIHYDISKALSDTSVTDDEEKFRELMNDETYSVISIGHTHGNVSEQLKLTSLARTLPNEIKEKYDIRDTGLNISVADIWQHEAFISIAKELSTSKEILQTIIMFNGDMVMINPNGITKSSQVQTVLLDGSYEVVPTDENKEFSHKQLR